MTEMVIQQLLMEAGAHGRRPGPRRSSSRRASRWRPTGGRCSRPRRTSGMARAAASRSERDAALDRPHAYSLPSLRLNQWALGGDVDGRAPRGRAERGQRTDRVPLPRARREPGDGTGRRGERRSRSACSSTASRPARRAGVDVDASGGGTVDAQRTYQLIRQPGPISERLFEIEFLGAGVEAYCFTFG